MALLAILGLLLLIFTSALIARLSLNDLTQQRLQVTAASLATVRDALMGYALQATTNTQPPGSLPCPAQNRGGKEAFKAAGVCLLPSGLVPYRDLNIAEPLDGTGAPLWYAPDPALSGNSNLALLRNSSTPTNLNLKINATNKLEAVAFVLIAPNQPLGAQQPNTSPLAAASEFLEGTNAAVNTTQYDDLNDAQHNDQVLGMPLGQFWSRVEQRVLIEVKQMLVNYLIQCKQYPWAAAWGGNNSKSNLTAGGVPLGTAHPFDWGATCNGQPVPARPTWSKHWSTLYYAICDVPATNPPTNPPGASCLQVTTPPAGNKAARVIVMAPGVVVSGVVPAQNRNLTGLRQYFEDRNADLDGNTHTFTQLPVSQHDQGFNDVLFIVE
jgi:hypothetical protein